MDPMSVAAWGPQCDKGRWEIALGGHSGHGRGLHVTWEAGRGSQMPLDGGPEPVTPARQTSGEGTAGQGLVHEPWPTARTLFRLLLAFGSFLGFL